MSDDDQKSDEILDKAFKALTKAIKSKEALEARDKAADSVLEFAKMLRADHERVAKEDAKSLGLCDCNKDDPYIAMRHVHEHGHVVLEKMMGTELDIVNNARVSFNSESDEMDERNRGLINFLMRERHASPFEAIVFRFDIRAPLFVIREWQRHRIGSFNEESARYSVIREDFYVPEAEYVRSQHGKPGAYYFEPIEDPKVVDEAQYLIDYAQREAFRAYNRMLELGVAKEAARTVLPVGMYSRMKWTVNLRSLINFLSLRNHPHAQQEIRDFAETVEEVVAEQIPFVIEKWNEHGRFPI